MKINFKIYITNCLLSKEVVFMSRRKDNLILKVTTVKNSMNNESLPQISDKLLPVVTPNPHNVSNPHTRLRPLTTRTKPKWSIFHRVQFNHMMQSYCPKFREK